MSRRSVQWARACRQAGERPERILPRDVLHSQGRARFKKVTLDDENEVTSIKMYPGIPSNRVVSRAPSPRKTNLMLASVQTKTRR